MTADDAPPEPAAPAIRRTYGAGELATDAPIGAKSGKTPARTPAPKSSPESNRRNLKAQEAPAGVNHSMLELGVRRKQRHATDTGIGSRLERQRGATTGDPVPSIVPRLGARSSTAGPAVTESGELLVEEEKPGKGWDSDGDDPGPVAKPAKLPTPRNTPERKPRRVRAQSFADYGGRGAGESSSKPLQLPKPGANGGGTAAAENERKSRASASHTPPEQPEDTSPGMINRLFRRRHHTAGPSLEAVLHRHDRHSGTGQNSGAGGAGADAGSAPHGSGVMGALAGLGRRRNTSTNSCEPVIEGVPSQPTLPTAQPGSPAPWRATGRV